MDLPSQYFSTKGPSPTAFTPEPVRRRVAGVKQILLMIAVVTLVGCGKEEVMPKPAEVGIVKPTAVPANIADPIVEKAIRQSLKMPTGELTEADLAECRAAVGA
jgi:hypothetical protein